MEVREGDAQPPSEHRDFAVKCRRSCPEQCWVRVEAVVQEVESLRGFVDRFFAAYGSKQAEPGLSHLYHDIRRHNERMVRMRDRGERR